MNQTFFSRLANRAEEVNSLLCVGLDPRVNLSPESEMSEAVQSIVESNRKIIEAVSDQVLAFKPNIAFYEAYGIPGLEALEITLGMIPSEVPIILDAKRGDIGATGQAYARGVFEAFGADAVTLSPYMGKDSIDPFLEYQDKGVFILCRTSNPGNADFQNELLANGKSLYLYTGKRAVSWDPSRVGLVVAANDTPALKLLRKELPETWFLSPGIGVQGGDIAEAVSLGVRKDGLGILPVVARGITQDNDPKGTAASLNNQINKARTSSRGTGWSKSSEIQDPTKAQKNSAPLNPLSSAVLQGLLDADCFRVGTFTLKSGAQSPFYIDLRLIMSDPKLLALVAKAYSSLLQQEPLHGVKFDRIAGIPAAGLPLAAAVSLETGIPMIFPRTTQKDHGTGRMIEGAYKEGERVLLLDDLITSGTSKIEAAELLRQAGLVVEHLVVLLERGAQGRKDMTSAGMALSAFAHVKEFFPLLEEAEVITPQQRKEMEAYAQH